MQWEQIVLIVIAVWIAIVSFVASRLSRRVAQLEKQVPKHTHPGEEILFTTKVAPEKPAGAPPQ